MTAMKSTIRSTMVSTTVMTRNKIASMSTRSPAISSTRMIVMVATTRSTAAINTATTKRKRITNTT